MGLIQRNPKQLSTYHGHPFKGNVKPTPNWHCTVHLLQGPSVFSVHKKGCDAASLHTLQKQEQKLQAKVLALAAMRKKLIKEAENTNGPNGSTVQVCFLAQLLQHCQPL